MTSALDVAPPGTVTKPVPRRHRLRRGLLAVAAVVVLAALGAGLAYRDQLLRYATHLKGSPTSTEPYRAFPPDAAPLARLAVVGDIGEPGGRIQATADAVAALSEPDPYDALLVLGDNAYPAGDPARLDAVLFEPFGPLLASGTQLLAILGNHDVMDEHAAAQVERLGMPGRWWARTIGDVLVVGLDSTAVEDPDQRRFLERSLATTTAPWKIVLVHHPPYSAGYQGSNEAVRDAFSPLFARYGVQLVLSGHDHDYQRSEPIDGVVYVVTGGAARTRRTGEDGFTAVSFSWHHFVEVNVFEDRLVVRAVNQDQRVGDEATIPR